MLDVDDVVADLEIAEIGEKGGDFGFLAPWARGHEIGFVEEIAGSEDGDMSFGEDEAVGDVGLEQRGGENFSGKVGGFVGIAFAAAGAASETIAGVVFGEDVGKALDLSGVGRGEDDAIAADVSFFTSSIMLGTLPWKRGRAGRGRRRLRRSLLSLRCRRAAGCQIFEISAGEDRAYLARLRA